MNGPNWGHSCVKYYMFTKLAMKDVYDNSYLSFVLEFFTPLSKKEAAGRFSNALGKKIEHRDALENKVEPTYEKFTLAPNYSNGFKEMALSTGFLPYQEAIHMLYKSMNVIEAIGYTTDRCTVKTSIKIDERALGLDSSVGKLNKMKYLMALNEDKISALWSQGGTDNTKVDRNHLHFVKYRDLYHTIINEKYVEKMDPSEFYFPESDFYTNDFSKLSEGKMVINYISGKDYTKKKKEATITINSVIEALYETLSANYQYSPEEKGKIRRMAEDFQKSVDGTKNYFNFKRMYPNVRMYVDLSPSEYLVESNYLLLRDKIFKVIVGGQVNDCVINYDTNRKRLQFKGADVQRNIVIEGVEFYDSKISADITGCLFENCTIRNSKLTECIVYSNNFIKSSKLIGCEFLGGSNEVSLSYLKMSEGQMIDADVRECLVQGGVFTMDSTVDQSTKMIP